MNILHKLGAALGLIASTPGLGDLPRFTPDGPIDPRARNGGYYSKGGRPQPRFVEHDTSRRKNPIPGGRGHYKFTGPAGPSFHARRRQEIFAEFAELRKGS